MSVETIRKCSFERWYDVFRKRTVRSLVIDMSDEFRKFLLDGEFIVDEGMFPDLRRAVDQGIEELGGRAFVKLNFTAPMDAQWASRDRTMLVRNFDDALYLLKASTRVLIDMTSPFGVEMKVDRPIIVLKKWFSYARNREFRVFVRKPGACAITSRYCDVPGDLSCEEVENLIRPFIDEAVADFPEEKVIFDVYISPKLRVHIVDIQPWNMTADTGMFTWDELVVVNECETRVCTTARVVPTEDSAPVELQDGMSLDAMIESMKEFEQEHL